MRTKQAAAKRFKVTANGKVKAGQANKRHNMRKRSLRQISNQRGTDVLPDVEAIRAKRYLPYANRNCAAKKCSLNQHQDAEVSLSDVGAISKIYSRAKRIFRQISN